MRLKRGVALIFVLIAIFCFFLFFLSFQYFSQSEYRHLDKVLSNITIDYLVRMGLNIAEDKLQKGRWYGETTSHGKFVVPNVPVSGAKITIYADDYCKKEWKKIGKFEYAILDHVKVFVEVSYKGLKMYGYGKYIMSPEPLLGGTSTKGVDINFLSTGTCPLTFRKMVHVRLLKESRIITDVPKFTSMDDFSSRKALVEYLKQELKVFSENYVRNFSMAGNVARDFHPTQTALDKAGLVNLLKGCDAPPPALSENQTKNFFILENLRRFPMDVNWETDPAEKTGQIGKVAIHLPVDSLSAPDPNVETAIKIVFGEGNPKKMIEGKDYWKEFQPSTGKTAVDAYFEKKGISGFPDKDPRALQDELSRAPTRCAYKFQWKALATAPDGKTISEGGPATFLHYWNNQTNSQVFMPGGKVVINSKEGPTIKYTNYVLMEGGKKLPLAFAFNIFMKYVDESAIYTPDSPIKDPGQWTTAGGGGPPGDGSGGQPVKEWDDISFE